MAEKVLVLHIGTHKTGTKSLQGMLAENPTWFAEQGLYHPTTGRLRDGGHHNIAWELTGDVRFEPHHGSLDELARELADHEPRSVFLSSEDFESLYRRMEPLTRFRSAFEELGYRVETVVVLRDPAEYVPSLYWELRKHGLRQTPGDFVAGVIANGGVMYRNWDLRVNYELLLGGFTEAFGTGTVHAVRYDHEDSVRVVLEAASALLRVPVVPIEGWTRRNVHEPDRAGSLSFSEMTSTAELDDAMSDAQLESIEAAFNGLVEDLVARYPV